MSQAYSDPKRANDPHALPDVEVFRVMPAQDSSSVCDHTCRVGCLPDGEPNGPFATEAEALADAQIDAEVDAQAEEIMSRDPRWNREASGDGEEIKVGSPAYGATMTDSEQDDLPPCVLAMKCYCAGHARGNPASAPCDTNESPDDEAESFEGEVLADDEPGEEDYYLSDDERSIYYCGKRIVGPVSADAEPCPQDAVMRELADYVEQDGFFPNVWSINDHGNPLLISVLVALLP